MNNAEYEAILRPLYDEYNLCSKAVDALEKANDMRAEAFAKRRIQIQKKINLVYVQYHKDRRGR